MMATMWDNNTYESQMVGESPCVDFISLSRAVLELGIQKETFLFNTLHFEIIETSAIVVNHQYLYQYLNHVLKSCTCIMYTSTYLNHD